MVSYKQIKINCMPRLHAVDFVDVSCILPIKFFLAFFIFTRLRQSVGINLIFATRTYMHILQNIQYSKIFTLFVLRFNNFSIMLERSHRLLGFKQYSEELMCLAHGHNTVPAMMIEPRTSRFGVVPHRAPQYSKV